MPFLMVRIKKIFPLMFSMVYIGTICEGNLCDPNQCSGMGVWLKGEEGGDNV